MAAGKSAHVYNDGNLAGGGLGVGEYWAGGRGEEWEGEGCMAGKGVGSGGRERKQEVIHFFPRLRPLIIILCSQ